MTWVFITNITDEFNLGIDTMHAHDASVDLRRHMLWLGDEEVPLQHAGVQPHSIPCRKSNSEVAVVHCDSHNDPAGRTTGGDRKASRDGLQGCLSSWSKNTGPNLKEGACNNDWRLPVAAHWGRCTCKRTMALKIRNPYKDAGGEQQCETQPIWRPYVTEQKHSCPAWCGCAVQKGDHRHHRNVPSKR
jgi:hypothetical protein